MERVGARDGVALFLPPEIITNILKLLPVKSLIKFQCVCQHWMNLMKTPSFIAEHLHHSAQLGPLLLLHRHQHGNGLQLYFRDCKMQIVKFQNLPAVDGEVRIAGSSNGLLCLRIEESGGSMYGSCLLWNPAFTEVRHVPPPFPCFDQAGSKGIGFGFSPIVDDYKIVTLYESMDDDVQFHCVVYSLGIGSWKQIEVKILGLIFLLGSVGFTMNGSIFWLGYKQGNSGYVLISFDMAMEEFALIPMSSVPLSNAYGIHVTEFEHRLAVLVVLRSSRIINYKSCVIELWVLEEGTGGSGERWSWAKKYSSSRYSCVLIPHTIWRNQIACVSYCGGRLGKKILRLVGTVMSNFTNTELNLLSDEAHRIYNYVESLVPVTNTHAQES